MPSSVELRQERARVVESLRSITEAAEKENRNLNADEKSAYAKHEADFTGLTERIGRQEALEQREAEAAKPIEGGQQRGHDGQGKDGKAAEKRAAFFNALRRGMNNLAPEQRALVEDANGEILVPEDLEKEILRSLPDITVVRPLASKRSVSTNRVRRRSLAEVAVGWGKLETNQQVLTDSMPGVPTEEFTHIEDLYGLAKIGEDELDDTDSNLEAFVEDSFTRAVGEAEDTGFMIGGGHVNKQPVGMMTALGGVPTVAAAAAADVSVDDYLKLIYATPAQYRRNGRFIMASASELVLATKKDANGQYLWQPSVQAGRPNTFKGYAIDNQEDVAAIAASARSAIFGDINAGYRVYDRLGITIKRLNELYAEDGMVGWKLRYRVGGDVVRPLAMRILVHPGA